MTMNTDDRMFGEMFGQGSQEHRTPIAQANAELSKEASTQSDVVIVGGRLFAYACLIAVPAVILVLIAFGLPRGAGALLGGVLAAWIVSLLIADHCPQAAEVRSARPARDAEGGRLMARRAREIAQATDQAQRLEHGRTRPDPHTKATDFCGSR
jgi:hypothetical protein